MITWFLDVKDLHSVRNKTQRFEKLIYYRLQVKRWESYLVTSSEYGNKSTFLNSAFVNKSIRRT